MSRERVPILVRIGRVARLVAHLVYGLYLLYRRFPRLDARGRTDTISRWSRDLLGIMGMRVRAVDAPRAWPARCMLVSNHVSWIDVFAILAVAPCVFVAKSEIRGWPLVGRLVTLVGTLYIERGKHRQAQRISRDIAAALERGQMIGLCPEGTTTDGDRLLKFHTALFQPPIDAAAMLQPTAIRYLDTEGERTTAASYVDTHTLVGSVWRIAGEPFLTAELRFGPPIPAIGHDRRSLAARSRREIAGLLGLTPDHTEPEIRIGHPA